MLRRTLPGLLRSAARSGGALHYGGERLSYSSLERDSRRVAAALRGLGVGPGDRIAVWLPNTPAFLALVFACARIGAIAVAVNTRFRSAELGDIVGRSAARVLVLWPGFRDLDFLGILEGVDRGAFDRLERIVLYREGGGELPRRVLDRDTIDYDDLRRARADDLDAATRESGCLLFTTSGTTRAPKFVLHRQGALVDHAAAVASRFGYGAADARLAQVLPLCGVFGLCQMMATLAAGRDTVLLAAFEAGELARRIASEGITHTNGADDMFRRLFEAAGESDSLGSLRQCGFAAFTGQPEELVAAGDRHGVGLVGLYGMSEVQAFFAARSSDDPPERRALAGGRPLAEVARVRVRDRESGALLPPGEVGELEVAGPSLMAGYFEDEEATAAALTGDGFVRTGDLGCLEEEGSFRFDARIGDALRLGGFLVAPAEIEAHLETHPAVAGAQVVGTCTRGGTRPVAFVVPSPERPFDEPDLRRHCAAGLARFKVPVRIVALESFPTTEGPNGTKIQRVKLRQMAEEILEREAAGEGEPQARSR